MPLRGAGLVALAALVTPPRVQAQVPGTDIYIAALTTRAGRPTVGPLRRLTDRPGYDNQPFFAPDGKSLYFTAIGASDPPGQADIYRLELGSGRVSQVTRTPESEYSPTVMPGGRELAVIRVEADSTQRLWAFPVGGGPPRLLLERVRPTGYQAWLDAQTVGLFVLGSPATLQVADLRTGEARILLADIGRPLKTTPAGRRLSVTQRVADDVWWIVEVDPATAATRPLVRMPAGAEYYAWLPDGTLLSAQGTTLLWCRPGADTTFSAIAVLDLPGPISRIAVSPKGDRIALVAAEAR